MTSRAPLAVLIGLLLAVAVPARAQDCTADVEILEQNGLKVDVAYRCRADKALDFTADGERSARRVDGFRGRATGSPGGLAWRVEPEGGHVEARYRFDLAAYAKSVNDSTIAIQRGEGTLMLLSGWLLEPRGFGFNPAIDIRVRTAPGLVFAAGLPRSGDTWRLDGNINIRFAGYTAIGRMHHETLDVPAPGARRAGAEPHKGSVQFVVLGNPSNGELSDLRGWVTRTIDATSNYWEGFIAPRMLLAIVPIEGRGVTGNARTVAGGGVTTVVEVAVPTDNIPLYRDPVLLHELVHGGMPFLRGKSGWFMEGAATYIAPIILARAGWKPEGDAWDRLRRDTAQVGKAFEQGLPQVPPRLIHSAGAAFMLLADLEYRRVTGGTEGLEDCVKGVLWSGLDGARRASLEEYVAACDKATGLDVMSRLVAKHSAKGQAIDVANLWSRLGVGKDRTFDDDAPDAKWRKVIMFGTRPPAIVKQPWDK